MKEDDVKLNNYLEKFFTEEAPPSKKVAKESAKLSKKQKNKFGKVMKEFASGKLKSGSGDKVTDQKQAAAIAYSEIGKSKDEKKKKEKK